MARHELAGSELDTGKVCRGRVSDIFGDPQRMAGLGFVSASRGRLQ